MKQILLLTALVLLFSSCKKKQNEYDASGSFEAVETIVSAEAGGQILQLDLNEGQILKPGQVIGYIDSTQLLLKKRQLQAQISAVLGKKPDVNAQLAAYKEQLKQAIREQQRIGNLVKADAATPKQLDDANSQVAVTRKQIDAQESALNITTSDIGREALPLEAQIDQIDDQIAKCRLVNQVNGTVLTKYVEVSEMATPGKPLYKIGDLSDIILRAYITGDQLPQIKTGMQVSVQVDGPQQGYKKYRGTVEWISDKAEFTPKTIQTKDERANLVYALKVRVKNDGFLKIGMYGDLSFKP
ncbi:MAG: HlyD family efflux transporter periplasmic adaptor subunit [Bacteroidota bacterium]